MPDLSSQNKVEQAQASSKISDEQMLFGADFKLAAGEKRVRKVSDSNTELELKKIAPESAPKILKVSNEQKVIDITEEKKEVKPDVYREASVRSSKLAEIEKTVLSDNEKKSKPTPKQASVIKSSQPV